jgi:DNA mismatch repair protein MutS
MHQVKEGAANQSYGLQVAQLAGVPTDVIQAAKLKLQQLEQSRYQSDDVQKQPQPDLFVTPQRSELDEAFDSINPDELSPKQALELLYELKQRSS